MRMSVSLCLCIGALKLIKIHTSGKQSEESISLPRLWCASQLRQHARVDKPNRLASRRQISWPEIECLSPVSPQLTTTTNLPCLSRKQPDLSQ